MRRWLGGLVSTMAVTLLVTSLGTTPSAAAQADGPVRILVLGDSISSGSSGDWTWRYRLWQHLRDDAVDFVGPVEGVHTWLAPTAPASDMTYADTEFEASGQTRSATRWGMMAGNPAWSYPSLVEDYAPDVVVALLGFNDSIYFGSGAATDAVRSMITQLQQADPDLDIIVGEYPQVWAAGIPALNTAIDAMGTEFTTDTSRVVVARSDPTFDKATDTFDTSHPSAQGEVKIAAQMADALAGLGIGGEYDRSQPLPDNGPSRAATLTGTSGNRTVSLSWTSPPGLSGSYLMRRDLTAGRDWRVIPGADFPVSAASKATVDGLINGHTYAFRLQPYKGFLASTTVFSNVVRLRPVGPRPARATGLAVVRLRHSAKVAWRPAARASGYDVRWRRLGATNWHRLPSVRKPVATVPANRPHQRYAVQVRPRNERPALQWAGAVVPRYRR